MKKIDNNINKNKKNKEQDIKISFDQKQKKLIRWMVFGLICIFIIMIVIPVYLYRHQGKTPNPDEFSLVKEVATDENQSNDDKTVEEQKLEEDVKTLENSGQNVDPFYPLILKQIKVQKQNSFIVVPENYMPGDNYLLNAATESGKIHIFKKNPIYVYVPQGEYFNPITQAFASYNYTFKGLLAFQAVYNPALADIVVEVKNDLSDKSDMDTAIGVGGPDKYDKDGNIKASHIMLLDHHPKSGGKVSLIDMYNVTLHEIGHAIGIAGHSQNENDVLYQATKTSANDLATLSDRDIETIKIMYSGQDELIKKMLDKVYDTKLLENLSYAQMNNNSDAYLDVADSYYYAKQYDKALNAYIKALKLNPDNPRIYIKLASCYITAEKYDTAIQYAQKGFDKSTTDEQKAKATYYLAYAYESKEDYDTALKYEYDLIEYQKNEKAPFLAYLQNCKKYDKKREANRAYIKYLKNYENDFTEQEKLLLKWASSPF